jgi:hypothetical protein
VRLLDVENSSPKPVDFIPSIYFLSVILFDYFFEA